MTSAPVRPMAKSKPAPEYCTYAPARLDDEVLPLVEAAAALSKPRKTIGEWLSDVANEAASRQLERKPIARRPAPPKPHGKGRPAAG
jgi:hypothetical protein